jgi:hypothetical protein
MEVFKYLFPVCLNTRTTFREEAVIDGGHRSARELNPKYLKPLIVNGFATLNPEIIA